MADNPRNAPLLSIALVGGTVVVYGLMFGFSTAIVAGLLDDIADAHGLHTNQLEAVIAVLVFSAFAGALVASPISARFGRRAALGLAALLALGGYVWILFEPVLTELVLARIAIGLAVGMSSMVAPMYAAEATAPRYRGAVVSIYQLAVTIGILLAYATPLAFGDTFAWYELMGSGVLVGLAGVVVVLLIPESPRWLMKQGKVGRAARAAAFLGVAQDSPRVSGTGTRGSLAAVFVGTVPLVLALCGGLFILQNLSGIDGILYYAPRIFEELGFGKGGAALTATFLLGAVNVAATIGAMLVVDKLGRRPLLLWGSALMALGLLSVVGAHLTGNGALGLIGLCTYIAAFAFSLGPLPYVMMSELFPSTIREPGIAVAAATSWLFNALVALFFLSAMQALGVIVVFLFFVAVCLLSLIVGLFAMPETKNMSLDEIENNVLAGSRLRWLGR